MQCLSTTHTAQKQKQPFIPAAPQGGDFAEVDPQSSADSPHLVAAAVEALEIAGSC